MDDVHTQTQARQLLATAYDTIPVGGDLLGGVRRRQARQRMRARAGIAAGTAMAAGAGALFAVMAVPAAPSALAAVTSAAAKTAGQSYRVTIAESSTLTGHPTASAQDEHARVRATGEFDPARHIGEETMSNGLQSRYIGEYVYTDIGKYRPIVLGGGTKLGPGRPWVRLRVANPAKPNLPAALRLMDGLLGREPADPQDLLTLLRTATTVRDDGPASGPGWAGTTYSFSATFKGTPFSGISGTVYVDQQGRVRRLAVTREMLGRVAALTGIRSVTDDITFSDFGVRVTVTVPPASQVFPGPASSSLR